MSTGIVVWQGKYRLRLLIANGGFGQIWAAVSTQYSGLKEDPLFLPHPLVVAVKLEEASPKSVLRNEYRILCHLRQISDCIGIPRVMWYGNEGDFNMLVMEFLGPSLESMVRYVRGKVEPKTVIILAIQLLQRLQYIHWHGFVHRDIKPDNIVLGRHHLGHHVYIIDYGLSGRFGRRSSDAGGELVLCPMREKITVRGTLKFSSIRTYEAVTTTRRDDLESLGYTLLYITRGLLPWDDVPRQIPREKRIRIVQERKRSATFTFDPFCSLLSDFVHYSRGLGFSDAPDYDAWIENFRAFARDGNLTIDDSMMQWYHPTHIRTAPTNSDSSWGTRISSLPPLSAVVSDECVSDVQ